MNLYQRQKPPADSKSPVTVWLSAAILSALACAIALSLLMWRKPHRSRRLAPAAPQVTVPKVAPPEKPPTDVPIGRSPQFKPSDQLVTSLRKSSSVPPREETAPSARSRESHGDLYSLAFLKESAPLDNTMISDEKRGLLVDGSTGAVIRPAAHHRDYYVSHVPIDDLQFSLLRAAEKRDRAGFEVQPFTQLPCRPLKGITDVEHAGEILALAIAQQLAATDLRVRLNLDSAAQERLGSIEPDSVAMAEDDRWNTLLREAWSNLDLRWELSGMVRFWTIERRGPEGGSMTAYVALLPEITITEDAAEESSDMLTHRLYSPPPIIEQESVWLSSSGDASEAGRRAASRVLDRVVRRLLGSPQLEKSLVDHLLAHGASASYETNG